LTIITRNIFALQVIRQLSLAQAWIWFSSIWRQAWLREF